MKTHFLVFLIVVFLLLLVVPVVSQVLETTWTADIPYEFIVAGNHMPAGQYIVKSNAQTMRLTLINKQTRQTAYMLTRNVEKLTADERTVLIFQQQGDGRYVLHQIWGGNETIGHDIVHGSEVIELTKVK